MYILELSAVLLCAVMLGFCQCSCSCGVNRENRHCTEGMGNILLTDNL